MKGNYDEMYDGYQEGADYGYDNMYQQGAFHGDMYGRYGGYDDFTGRGMGGYGGYDDFHGGYGG